MSYQVLARKWRPKVFAELIGQEHVVSVLVNALYQDRLHHAYLFTGTRGVGKTTIARIFAKSLNCEQGITSTPCGVCQACIDIDQGRFVDLLEIDAASRTKVDDTREILDNVQYAPTRGRFKVYLIDEVHMLSKSSFNALLKTLEEPPEHVKFILATTDPQKLPITVLSRCLQFHLKALTVSQIEQKTKQILDDENVTYQAGSLTLLAKAARGSMRDCLSLTDQSIAQGAGEINLANIQQMLGGIDQNWLYKIIIALLKQDGQNLMKLSLEIASYAPNYSRLIAEFIQLFHQIAMVQIIGQHFDLAPEHNKLLEKFGQAMSPEDVQLYYQIVLNSRKDLPYACDEQAAFDMLLLRLLAFKPRVNEDGLPEVVNKQKISEDYFEDFEQSSLADIQSSEDNTAIKENLSTQVDDLPIKAIPPTVIHEVEQGADGNEASAELNKPNYDSVAHQGFDIEAELSEQMFEIEQTAAEFQHFSSESVETSSSVVKDPVGNSHEELNNQPQESKTTSSALTPIETVLASRNMLRSRKKALENSGKKSSDAKARPEQNSSTDTAPLKTKQVTVKDVPAIETITSQPFDIQAIDPAAIRSANQVDKWANMIDAMALGGRLRQLAIHATISESSTDDLLILNLDQSTKHLNSDAAHKQLEENITQFLSRVIKVEVHVVEATKADPYQIQSHINDKRYDYAKELLEQDEFVISLKENFQAELNEKTIVAL